MNNKQSIKAVLFDLDDTLFDHQHSRRCGLRALQATYPILQSVSLPVLETRHEMLLAANYDQVLQGKISMDAARIARMQALCEAYGLPLSAGEAESATLCYRQAYEQNRRAIPGIKPLLEALKERVRLGIITNGLVDVQHEKLRICQLTGYFDAFVISEEVGVKKPDPKIFSIALKELDVKAPEAGFVGDSWQADMLGAQASGLRAVWLNRYDLPCPDRNIALEITHYEPMAAILQVLFNSNGTRTKDTL